MKSALLITTCVVALAGTAFAQPAPCQLDDAARAYAAADFDQAQRLIAACMAGRPSTDERTQAYALRAKLSLALDDVEAAQLAVAALLGATPDFTPRLDDPPRFVLMVGQLKRELARTTTSSVSKMNESLLEAPATVIVLTAEQIRRRGYLDLEAALHDLPGFDISRSNGYSYSNLYQRGYRSDTTNRTLFLVDGVEQNDLHSNTAHISRQFPLTNIDRVEVVYGPASTMYGANAFLGVINVITKDPDDVIKEGKSIGADVQAGGGAWNTRFLDGTVAGRYRGATLSLTGRVYKSDEWDLSRYANWNYDPAFYSSQAAKDRYDQLLFGSDVGAFIKLLFGDARFADPYNPISLDQKALQSSLNGHPVAYSELTDDWMVSGRLKLNNFTVGVQAWQRREGATGEGTDMEVPGALNGNVWIPRETSFFVRYAAPLSGSVSFSYLGQAKIHSLGVGSSVFSLNGYQNGPFDTSDLFANFDFSHDDGFPAFWTQAVVAQSSNQIRNELNLVYRRANTLSIVGGVDLRHGSVQADYVKGTDCIPFPPLFSDVRDDQLVKGVTDNASNSLVTGRVLQLLAFPNPGGGVWVHCSRTGAPASLPNVGGEHFAVRDIGAFAQASYKPRPTIKLVAGWRVDNNHIDQGSGFGTVFTPRLGIVYSPHGFVTKAIYSEAFKDPSNLERYGTIPGVLALPQHALQPEEAKNFELSAGRQWGRFTADLAAYQTTYSSLVTLAAQNLASDSDVQKFITDIQTRLGSDLNIFTVQDAIAAALPSVVAAEPPEVLRKVFDEPIFIQRFENSGALRVRGVQANASFQYRSIDLFGNYTYTQPIFTERPNERTLSRVGDIASHHVNVGAQRRWGKLDTGLRLNYVGSRRTAANPPLEVPSYAVANAVVSYDILPGVSAQLVVNNLFDAQYSDPGVRTADNIRFAGSIPQPGRSIFLRVMTRVF